MSSESTLNEKLRRFFEALPPFVIRLIKSNDPQLYDLHEEIAQELFEEIEADMTRQKQADVDAARERDWEKSVEDSRKWADSQHENLSSNQ